MSKCRKKLSHPKGYLLVFPSIVRFLFEMTISVDDPRPLQAAGKFIIEEYARVNQIADEDRSSKQLKFQQFLDEKILEEELDHL